MKCTPCQIINHCELQPYEPTWQAMKQHCQDVANTDPDQLWLMEHEPVFTQGKAGKAEHVLNAHGIPVVHTDRGGQVTYHGPGQLMIYPLLNIERLKLNSRQLVRQLENSVIDTLKDFNITAVNNPDAPGVYVDGAKIASIGLRITRGHCYHGVALNTTMDLTPFQWINPCGYRNQPMTKIQDFYPNVHMHDVKSAFLKHFSTQFNLQLI